MLDRKRSHAESDGVSCFFFFFLLRGCGSSLVLQTCGSLLIWSNASACSMYVSYNVCRIGNFSNAASYSVCWSWNASNAALKASTDVNYGMCWPCNIKICCMDSASCSCSKTSILDGDITLLDRQRSHAESDCVSFFFFFCASVWFIPCFANVWLPPSLICRIGNFSNAASYSVCWSWNASDAALKASTDVNYGMCWSCNISAALTVECSKHRKLRPPRVVKREWTSPYYWEMVYELS